MKNIFFLLIILAGFSYSTGAQKITFGVSAGVSAANTIVKVKDNKGKWKAEEGLKAKNGFTGGVSADIPLSKHFSFQPAVNFLQKGFKNELAATTLTINCIEVPLNIMFKTSNKDTDKRADDFFFGIGPSVAFASSGEVKLKTDTGTFYKNIKFGGSDKDDIKGIDLGANVVMGCMFFNNFFFAVNYNFGLSNLSNVKEVRWRNNYYAFRVGYSFGNRRK